MHLSKYFFWLPAIVLISQSVYPQRPVEVSYHADAKGATIFTAQNNTFSPYVLNVSVPTLENGRSDHALPYEGVIRPGQNVLFKLSPTKGKEEMEFKYTVNFRKGTIDAPVKVEYPYLLPLQAGRETQAYITDTRSGEVQTLYAVRLRMKPGDTIFAARRGLVTAIDMEGGTALEIFQGDSSFAQYGVFRKDGALVKPGQTVEAGQPIGLVGGDQYGRGTEARLSVYYYQENMLRYIPLQFWTKRNGKALLKHGGEYVCEKPVDIVQQEVRKAPALKKSAKSKASH